MWCSSLVLPPPSKPLCISLTLYIVWCPPLTLWCRGSIGNPREGVSPSPAMLQDWKENLMRSRWSTWIISEVEPTSYIWDCSMALGNPYVKQCVPSLTILWMITWLWWEWLEKLRVSTNRKSKSPLVFWRQVFLVKAQPTRKGVLSRCSPALNGLKCSSC